MIKPEILRDIQWNAEAQRGGASVTIDYNLPTIAVELRNGDTFFFQGEEEASDLLSETMIDQTDEYIAPEDMILWLARGW